MLRRYYGKISKLPINEFVGHDGELVVDDISGKVYVMDGVTLGGTELVGATPQYGMSPPAHPTPGTLWYDPNSGRTFIYYQDTWVDASPNTTYTLPEASTDRLGGVKVDNTTIVIDEYGVISAIGDGTTSDRLVSGSKELVLGLDGNVTLPSGGTINFSNGHSILEGVSSIIPTATNNTLGVIKLGEGFSTDVNDRVTTNKLYSTNLTQPTQHYRLTLDTNGVVVLPDQSIINGATLRVVPGTGELNYAALAAGPDLSHPEQTWIWADANGAWVQTNSYVADIKWQFDNSGHLIMPGGSEHYDLASQNSILSHVLSVNGNDWKFDRNGSLTLPGEGTVTSTSGNITVQGNIDANSFHASQGPGLGYLFKDPVTGRYTSGMRHYNGDNTLQLVHEGNIGLTVYPNGSSKLSNVTVRGSLTVDQFNTFEVSTTKVFANVGYNNGYRFFDADTVKSTAVVHDNITNQLKLVHESGNVALNANGSLQTSNIIINGTMLTANVGTLYVDGVAVGSGGSGGYTIPSSTPPSSPTSGQLWYDTDIGKIYVYLADSWVDASPTFIPDVSSLTNGIYSVTLDSDGNLNLPVGGDILDSNGNSVLSTSTSQGHYSNSNVAAYLPTNSNIVGLKANANIQAIAINTLTANAVSQDIQIKGLRANITAANAAIITANVGMKSYVDTFLTTSTSNLSIQSNQINNLTANALSQDTQIKALRANIDAANGAIITANASMKSYVDSILLSNASSQESSITSLISNANIQAIAINSLIANALSQDTQIKGLRANIDAANSSILIANLSMKSYVDDVTYAWTANAIAQENEITLINANLASLIANANIQAFSINTLTANTLSQDTQIKGLRANVDAANAAILSANLSMKSYVDDVTYAWTANATTQENKLTSIISNVVTLTSNANVQAIAINSLTANALSQDTQIKGLRANVDAANSAISTLKTQVYSNANVFAFLPTYSGTIGGDISIGGNVSVPNLPAFRVTGKGGQISAVTQVTSTNWNVDYNQGSYLNGTTGYFTAPVAGIYQVNLVVRTYTNAGVASQAVIEKNNSTIMIMVEWAANTTMNHVGGSSAVKLAAGDTLRFRVLQGSISFDGNDNWSVAFLG